ncbi:ribonuclease domain-containing protein [Bacillus glycinifermentans]|uniref:ribonuclease domain-containing protein n=1 Tax=Bacillus glycinifermentans TaxID=1664069 RepID=UPI00405A20B8
MLHKKIKKLEEKILKEIETKIIPAINKALMIYKEISEMLDGVLDILNQMIEAENQMIKGLDEMNQAYREMNKSLDNVIYSMNEVNKAMDQCNKALDVSIKATNDMTKEVNAANANMNQMVKSINQANEGMKQLNKSADKINKAIKKTNSAFDDYDKKSNKVKGKKINKNQSKKLKQQTEKLKKAQKQVNDTNKKIKANEQTLKDGDFALSVLLDLTPVVSNIKSGAEFVVGEDLVTHERLSGYERTLSGISVFTSGIFKLAGKAMGMSSKTAKTAKVVENGAKRTDKIEVPSKAKYVLEEITKKNGTPPKGYKGGKPFENSGKYGGQKLPSNTTYKEYDVNPKVKGQDRGAERIVIGEDGSAWYTNDHYKTFVRMR